MYNLNRIHRYWTENPAEEQTHVIIKRNCYDCHKCENCELMNKAERCIKTIKKLAQKMQFLSNGEALYITTKGGKLFGNGATHRFKLDIQKAIREAYK